MRIRKNVPASLSPYAWLTCVGFVFLKESGQKDYDALNEGSCSSWQSLCDHFKGRVNAGTLKCPRHV